MREIQAKGGNFTKSEEYAFEKIGDNVTGTLVEKATLTSKKSGKPFQKYVILVNGGRNVGFLGNYDLDDKLGQVDTGTKVSVTLSKLSPNPHGGKDMKIFKVEADESASAPLPTKSAADVIKAARVA